MLKERARSSGHGATTGSPIAASRRLLEFADEWKRFRDAVEVVLGTGGG
jgi:hypothetical protein